MSINALSRAEKVVVGAKQTLKAVKNGSALQVYVAHDADPHIVKEIISASQELGLEIVETESMADLGLACSIKVGAAAAAIIDGREGGCGHADVKPVGKKRKKENN